jgi:hypothetical protein
MADTDVGSSQSGNKDAYAQTYGGPPGSAQELLKLTESSQNQQYTLTIDKTLRNDTQNTVFTEQITIDITFDPPVTNAPDQPELATPDPAVQGQSTPPSGKAGTGNPFFNMNPMATFFESFLKLMQIDQFMELTANKLSISNTNLMMAEAKDQSKDIIASGNAEADSLKDQAYFQFAQAGVSFAQTVGTGVLMGEASAKSDEDVTEAFSEMQDAQSDLHKAENDSPLFKGDGVDPGTGVQGAQSKLQVQEDRLDSLDKDPTDVKPEGMGKMKLEDEKSTEGAEDVEDTGGIEITEAETEDFQDTTTKTTKAGQGIRDEQKKLENAINDETETIANKQSEIRRLDEESTVPNPVKMAKKSKNMKAAKQELKAAQSNRATKRVEQNKLEVKAREDEVDAKAKVVKDDESGVNLDKKIEKLRLEGPDEGTPEMAEIDRLEGLRTDDKAIRNIQEGNLKYRGPGPHDPDEVKSFEEGKAELKEKLEKKVEDAKDDLAKARTKLDKEDPKVAAARERFNKAEANYSNSARNASERMNNLQNNPHYMLIQSIGQTLNTSLGASSSILQAHFKLIQADWDAKRTLDGAYQSVFQTESGNMLAFYQDLYKQVDGLADALTQLAAQQNQMHLAG